MAFFISSARNGLKNGSNPSITRKYTSKDFALEETDNLGWATAIDDSVKYRRAEFKRILGKCKALYEGNIHSHIICQYTIRIHCEYDISENKSQVNKLDSPILVMMFGTENFLDKQEIQFSETLAVGGSVEASFRAPFIGDIHALALGFEGETEFYIEHLSLLVNGEGIESEYVVPTYQWFSKNLADDSTFRFLWVHPRNEPPYEIEKLNFARPKNGVRKCKNKRLVVKRTFIEYCFKFAVGEYKWHFWYRYDTYHYFNRLLTRAFPELELANYFPDKSIFHSHDVLVERQSALDEWMRKILGNRTMLSNFLVQGLIKLPPLVVLNGESPLCALIKSD